MLGRSFPSAACAALVDSRRSRRRGRFIGWLPGCSRAARVPARVVRPRRRPPRLFPCEARGGASGAVVVPGKPGESLLIQAVRQTGELRMPPGEKLKPQEVAALEAWVQAGARWPTGDARTTPAAPVSGGKTTFTAAERTF